MTEMRDWIVLGTMVLTCVAACVSGDQLARDRAVREYNCPADEVKVRWISTGPNGTEIYKVAACGTVVTYACGSENEMCVKESDDRR